MASWGQKEKKPWIKGGREVGMYVCLRGLVELPAVAFPTSKRGREGLDERMEDSFGME